MPARQENEDIGLDFGPVPPTIFNAEEPALGAALRAAEEAWIAADFPLDRETIGRIATNAVQSAAQVT